MWPLDLPVGEVLKLPGHTMIPWAVFDPTWYRLNYPHVVDVVTGDQPERLLEYHIEEGQKLGHAPNRWFDEAWHRRAYPQIAEAIEQGRYVSAFDAYCRGGCLDRSPHWLFDEIGYTDRNPDLSAAMLRDAELTNGYDHYLRHGSHEDRVGHVLSDPLFYLASFEDAEVREVRRKGVFQHYLGRLEQGDPELPTSIYFEPEWYLRRYPDVAVAIGSGKWKSALHHYLTNDTPTAYDPLESFSEADYLRFDPGLGDAIAARQFRNGYMHFLRFGALELRPPKSSIDLAQYAKQPDVCAAMQQGLVPNAFAHWLTKRGDLRRTAAGSRRTKDSTSAFWHQMAHAALPIAGRYGYSFACNGPPRLSVVMVIQDKLTATLGTIASLRENGGGSVELILVDCGSTDETQAIGQYVSTAHLLRLERGVTWAQAANAGSRVATTPAILFLADEALLGPGAIGHACDRLGADPSVGAVGGMIIEPDGLIGQAGGIVCTDGTTYDYMRGACPSAPEANFLRSVAFCSAAFLLVRTDLLRALGGFHNECTTRRLASVDLCGRIIHAGSTVIYDPSVRSFHHDEDLAEAENVVGACCPGVRSACGYIVAAAAVL